MAGTNGKRSLEEILEEHLAVTKSGLDRVSQGLADVRLEMKQGFEKVDERFKQVDKRFERVEARLDNMLITMGGSRLDHEERISALEADVAKLKAG